MLDVSGTRIVTIKSLKVVSEHDLRIERCGYCYDGMRGRTLVRRKTRRVAVSGTTRFGTIQIAADASY
jgi:hypothetical protein